MTRNFVAAIYFETITRHLHIAHVSIVIYAVLVENMTFGFGELLRKLRLYTVNFNIFSSIPPSDDQYELQTQRISTRLFIILLALSLIILILYTSLINGTQTVNVDSPTMARYLQLYSTYPQTLSCDCKQISINYAIFVHLNYSLHQICSSVFTIPKIGSIICYVFVE
ncbi:unnamed protein product [Adineta ricciae]|uniref:Uncharacterized protein n=1 Tax=Adineta ricciae TaxID=249248 RepID=A0A815TWF0_ADIRI|nr:unnamed protein product [Adineta ricciae]CAF1508433.1 unnamed protein product [Adineta ricciae]